MKNIGLCLAFFSFLMITSCGKKVEKTTDTIETNTVTTDTVVKEVSKEEDGTSVKIDSNGVDVNSKKVELEVKK